MTSRNLFEEKFNTVTESGLQKENIRAKLIEGVYELGELKKTGLSIQRELAQTELELGKLKVSNKELKLTLMQALMEKMELLAKRKIAVERAEDLSQKMDELEQESTKILSGNHVEPFRSNFSVAQQCSLMNKIQDYTCKLIEHGLQPYSN